ncbi:MAG: hypothetical protein CVT92_08600 [Bacteroidetes bacterium HGW-Bacteroidetes-1]|jgi:hypothetical protein|nr:MAG: hypothetical protein CVT92_08600 [Bacteroidetes bacterium HGW-Bacteroidetes-1]
MKSILFFALLLFHSCASNLDDGKLIFVEADPQKGFQFPYFLYFPNGMSYEKELFLIVEPNNSGFVSDTFNEHIEKARRTAVKDFYIGNYTSRSLKIPLLVPVFPRSESEWKIYTHALDLDVMLQQGNSLERIDNQLIAMIDDAISTIKKQGFIMNDQILLTGFSASGTFVNRFSMIHPDKVFAVVAGGLNGLLMLPLSEINGKNLDYPLGINDYEKLFGKVFDAKTFNHIPQFLFMGELDDNDAISFEDGYDSTERALIYSSLGKEMLAQRWIKCKEIYNMKSVNATIKTFKGLGHEHPENVKKEALGFFEMILMNKNSQH